jgi:hypothetical protein
MDGARESGERAATEIVGRTRAMSAMTRRRPDALSVLNSTAALLRLVPDSSAVEFGRRRAGHEVTDPGTRL